MSSQCRMGAPWCATALDYQSQTMPARPVRARCGRRASAQTSCRPSKNHPKCCSVGRFYTSAIFAKIALKIRNMTQDASQNGAKLTILGSKLANIAPSWRHFGPTWAILATRRALRGLQIRPQMRSNSHLGPSWRQEGPQSAPRQPRSSIFSNFLPIWIRFWMPFRWLSMSILVACRHRFCLPCLYALAQFPVSISSSSR